MELTTRVMETDSICPLSSVSMRLVISAMWPPSRRESMMRARIRSRAWRRAWWLGESCAMETRRLISAWIFQPTASRAAPTSSGLSMLRSFSAMDWGFLGTARMNWDSSDDSPEAWSPSGSF